MKFFPQNIAVYFHDVDVNQFERTIKWFVRHKYRFVSTDELKQWYEGKFNPTQKICHVSFDDGKRSNVNLLGICEKYNVPITICIATGALNSGNYWWEYVKAEKGHFEAFKKYDFDRFNQELKLLKEKYELQRSALSVEELKEFEKSPLVTIASHTVSHYILTVVPENVLETELVESKNELEKLLKKEIDVFCYPNGSFSKREIERARKHYRFAFTTESKYLNRNTDDPMLIPRIALTGKYHRNLLKIFRIWQFFKRFKKFFSK